jgi:hypothetical protein
MSQTQVVVDMTFRGPGGKSITEAPPGLRAEDLASYVAPPELREEGVRALQGLGFTLIGPVSPYGVSVLGDAERVREVFGDPPLTVPPRLARYFGSATIPPPGEYLAED